MIHSLVAPLVQVKLKLKNKTSKIVRNVYQASPKRQQVVNVPEFNGQLESLFPNAIVAFLNRYKEYTAKYNIETTLVYFMTPVIRVNLRSACLPHGNMDDMLAMSNDELIILLIEYVNTGFINHINTKSGNTRHTRQSLLC